MRIMIIFFGILVISLIEIKMVFGRYFLKILLFYFFKEVILFFKRWVEVIIEKFILKL